jgi:hypothetical protein
MHLTARLVAFFQTLHSTKITCEGQTLQLILGGSYLIHAVNYFKLLSYLPAVRAAKPWPVGLTENQVAKITKSLILLLLSVVAPL